MYVIMQADEAWSVMALVVSQVLDNVALSADGRAAIKQWRTAHAEGTPAMDELAEALNDALGTRMDERTSKLIRRKGRYVPAKERG